MAEKNGFLFIIYCTFYERKGLQTCSLQLLPETRGNPVAPAPDETA